MSHLFNVYTLMDIEPIKAQGAFIWDKKNNQYLDFYGGHAVISIGHSHPTYIDMLKQQLDKIAFYSNAVQNPLQEYLAEQLTHISNCNNYKLFLCNSGAEANENALKLASFVSGRNKILSFKSSFHGRTSAAVAVTDNHTIQSPINRSHQVTFIPINNTEWMLRELRSKQYAAVIIEGIQGIAGIREIEADFLQQMRTVCSATDTIMILDEVQSGYARTGKFFAHQYANISPDIISMAKGMGNGFPIAGILIQEKIEAKNGMLGTTFGGSHLACAAGLAVLKVIKEENLMLKVNELGTYLKEEIGAIKGVKAVRGKGLMLGIDVEGGQLACRTKLIQNHKVIVGYSGQETIRLLPPLTITREQANLFLEAFRSVLES